MFLYELAIELDLRSTELAADASRLGMGEVGPTTDLSPEQVAALRAGLRVDVGRGAVPAWAEAAARSIPALAAPDGWGPAGAVPASPPGPPPGAPPTMVPPPLPPPLSAQPASPPAGADAPPPFPAPGGPPTGWGPTPSLPTPQPVDPSQRTWRDAPAQLAAIGVVVLLVAALFVYMAANSGPDETKEAQLRAADRRAEAAPAATLPPTTATFPTPVETTILPGSALDPDYEFVDRGRFCDGARGTAAFELRISAGAIEGDWQAVRSALVDGRSDWRTAVDELDAGAAPYLASDVDRYRTSYEQMIGDAEAASGAEGIQQAFSDGYSFALRRSAKKINGAIGSECGGG